MAVAAGPLFVQPVVRVALLLQLLLLLICLLVAYDAAALPLGVSLLVVSLAVSC